MNNFISRVLISILFSTLSFAALGADIIRIEPAEIAKGQEIELPVVCEADGNYIAFQTEITLPEGLSFATPAAYLSEVNSATHQLRSNLVGNTLKIASFSSSNKVYPDLQNLFFIKVIASSDFESGIIEISNTIFSTSDNQEVDFQNSNSTITGKKIEVESLSLSEPSIELKVGETAQLTATVLPETLADAVIMWETSNPLVATVNDGLISAVGLGSATITATCGNISATCEVTVIPTPIESISLSESVWNATEGESLKLTATVTPDNATNKAIDWSTSTPTVAAVDAEGNVTALAVGEAVITATAAEGSGVKAECRVTVSAKVIPAESISLSEKEWTAKVGESLTLTATVLPENATDKSVIWSSSDESVVTVTDGTLKALKIGNATITATCGNVSATCEVLVNPTPVETITISTIEWNATEGESIKLTVTVTPDNATNKAIDWSSSDAAVATVDAEGNVTALAPGEAIITATAADGSGVKAECRVSVYAKVIPAESISLSEKEWTAKVGESLTLTATVLPENATDKSVIWYSSDESVVTVTDGTLKALKIGNATITATCGNVSATCEVNVIPTLVESIVLSATEWNAVEGEALELSAVVAPDNATNKAIDWSTSNPTAATIDAEGNVTALAVGEAVITAAAADGSGIKAECRVTVSAKDIPAESISLSEKEWTAEVGESLTLTAIVLPENATDKSVSWSSSDESVATVTDGTLKALKIGNATITATCGNVSATCEVLVNPTPVETITLSTTEWSAIEEESIKLTATVSPDNATNKVIDWSTSDAAIATVDAEGNVTAVAVGEAVITATAADGSGIKAECRVTVSAKDIPAESISLSEKEWTAEVGESLTLTATVLPENATDKSVSWSSSDESVATVADGTVKALKIGNATITATCGNVSATCQINVIPTLVESIVLSATEWNAVEGESVKLTATITPDNATNKAIDWSTSDAAIATVDAEGNVKAVAVGEAVITATAHDGSGVTAECHVTVSANIIKVTAISLSATEWSGKAGESVALKATVLPADATNKAVRWSTSNADVATVDSKGLVTAVAVGSAIITATTADGTELSATCEVTVVPTPVETITLSATTWSGIVGATTQLSATVEPTDATDAAVIWSSTNESVATVDATGFITALKVGSATITATAADGSGVTATCRVTVKPILAASLTIDPENWEGEVGETFTITATVLPDNATDKSLAWSSSDEAVATVDSTGLVTTVGEGTCTIEVTTLDGSELKAECIVVTSLAGLSEIIADSDAATTVYTLDGILIKRDCSADDLRQLRPGFYIIRQGTKSKKIYLSTRP